jgi:hypothetical protein
MMGGSGQGYGPGMMDGLPYNGAGATITGTQPFGGSASGMMGAMMGGGMMGGLGQPANAKPITIDQAVAAAQQYVAGYNNRDLAPSEIIEFSNNFYVQVTEKSTGKGAFEVLVDRFSGAVYPEMGPNMMWNAKYSPLGQCAMFATALAPAAGSGADAGPSTWRGGTQSGPMTVTEQQARADAQRYLDANIPGATLADDAAAFYGHYTMDFLQNGKIAGMLSVNGYTGQVWYHSWHGVFIAEKGL